MLKKLVIDNYKLIENSKISFSDSLNIITGETGAGKSIILSAIKMLLGEKGSSQQLKNQTKPLIIEGFFNDITPVTLKILTDNEIEISDELHIYRRINSSGKNSIRVNGFPVNVSMLKDLSESLIEFCSQNQHQTLFSGKNQKELLDSFSQEIISCKKQYKQNREEYLKAKEIYENASRQINSIEQEKDFLKFQLNELIVADVKENEEQQLEQQRSVLKNITLLTQNSSEVINNLNQIDSLLRSSAISMEQMTGVDSNLENILSTINDALYNLEDSRSELNSFALNIDSGDMSLDEVEERLFTISSLKKKYGQDLNKAKENIENKLEQIDNPENSIEILKNKTEQAEQQTIKTGKQITVLRKKAADKIEKAVKSELKDLNLEHGLFNINIKTQQEILQDGLDKVEFMFTANPDKPLAPLSKVASGGELSRIMLALKTVFINNSFNSTIIFDEIDTGISGITAKKVSEKIKNLSEHFQVICVTHLPTVASKGNWHFGVHKNVKNDITNVSVTLLDNKSREEEIVRLLGASDSDTSREHARELLN